MRGANYGDMDSFDHLIEYLSDRLGRLHRGLR